MLSDILPRSARGGDMAGTRQQQHNGNYDWIKMRRHRGRRVV